MDSAVSSVDGSRVAYVRRGSGEPTLVFIHGLGGSRADFDSQVETFSRSYRCVAIDLRGSGDSGRDRTTWTMAAFEQDVVAVADHCGAEFRSS